MEVGTTKDQGLYNKPSAAVNPGALAVGTLPQYNTIHICIKTDRHGQRNVEKLTSYFCKSSVRNLKRQCTYNVNLRVFRATTVVLEKQ